MIRFHTSIKRVRDATAQLKSGRFKLSGSMARTLDEKETTWDVSGECIFDFSAGCYRLDRTEPAESIGGAGPITTRYLRVPGEVAVYNSRTSRIDFSRDGTELQTDLSSYDFRCFGLYVWSTFSRGESLDQVVSVYEKLKPVRFTSHENQTEEYGFDFADTFRFYVTLDPANSGLPLGYVLLSRDPAEPEAPPTQRRESSTVTWQMHNDVWIPASFHIQWKSPTVGKSPVVWDYRVNLRWESVNEPIDPIKFNRGDLSNAKGDYVAEWKNGKPTVVAILGSRFRPKP